MDPRHDPGPSCGRVCLAPPRPSRRLLHEQLSEGPAAAAASVRAERGRDEPAPGDPWQQPSEQPAPWPALHSRLLSHGPALLPPIHHARTGTCLAAIRRAGARGEGGARSMGLGRARKESETLWACLSPYMCVCSMATPSRGALAWRWRGASSCPSAACTWASTRPPTCSQVRPHMPHHIHMPSDPYTHHHVFSLLHPCPSPVVPL